MSRFSFGFGRNEKKNNKRHERDEFFLNRGQPQHPNYRQENVYDDEYDDQGNRYDDADENAVYDPRDPRFVMRPYRTEEANAVRNTRRGAEQLFPNRHSGHDYNQDDMARSPQNYRMTNDQRQNPSYDANEDSSMGFRRTHTGRDELGSRDEPLFSPSSSNRHYQGHPNQPPNQGYQRQSMQEEVKGLGFWRDNSEEEAYREEAADSDRPSPFKFVIAITGLVFVCAVTWIAYRWISSPTMDSPPLIQAETDPYRVRPENPGGAAFPHQDKLIYERLAPSSTDHNQPVERLLPAPEQPVIMQPTYQQDPATQYAMQAQQPYQQPNGQQPNGQQLYGAVSPKQFSQQGYAPSGVNGTQSQGQPVAPGYYQQPQVQPVPQQGYVQPQQGVQQNIQQPLPYAQGGYPVQQMPSNEIYSLQGGVQPGAYSVQTIQQHAPTDVNRVQMGQNPATLMSAETVAMPIQGAVHQQPQMVGAQQQLPVPAVVAQQNLEEPVDGIPHYLQLGTLPNKTLADKEKARLQKRYAVELVGMDLSVRTFIGADKKTKYRIVAGPMLRSRKAAIDKCAKLGGACQPVKG